VIATLRALPSDLWEALHFLTRLPLPGATPTRGPADAAAAFPLVGLVLGLVLVVLDALLGKTHLAGAGADALLVAASIAATGGLHLDGLMDTCDGIGVGGDRERRLDVMHDPHVGAFGVLGGVSVVLLKFGALASLHGTARPLALLLAPVLGRWGLVLCAAIYPPARPGGLGAAFRRGLTRPRLIVATLLSILISASSTLVASPASTGVSGGATLDRLLGLVVLGVVSLAAVLSGRGFTRLLGGLTGDTYGALVELGEVVALYTVAALIAA